MSFDIICFDCDSTLSKIEGIDELGKKAGLQQQMAAMTNAAMNGEITLEAVYKKRLNLLKPSKSHINWLAELYISKIVEGTIEVFKALLATNKQTYIISGGIRQAILPLAKKLGLAANCVHAVEIYFNKDNAYIDFDQQSPLAKTGGKAVICTQIHKLGKSMVMIGDGKTDLEAKQAGAKVIGFGGVIQRSIVSKQADIYIQDPSLTTILPYLL